MNLKVPDTPVVVVDLDKLETNIREMAEFAREAGVSLRPHIKSHKTVEIARKQMAAGAVGVTVAKLGEAEVMVEAGISDILIAYQVVGEVKLRRLMDLMGRATITVAVDTLPGARMLAEAARGRGRHVPVVVEVNSGLDRCGVLPGEETLCLVRQLLELPELIFKGLMTHAGQAYGASSPRQVAEIGRHEGEVMVATAGLLRKSGIPVETVSVGSTPTVKTSGRVKGVTEIRPGNYVFYDAIQHGLGVAPLERCALSVLATVISRPAPGRAVIDAGSKTFALDKGAHGTAVVQGFGVVKGLPGWQLTRLSEEHGILEDAAKMEREPEAGEVLEIIPNHACPVVNLTDRVLVVRSGKAVDEWRVAARGRVR